MQFEGTVLQADEKVLWSGKPATQALWRARSFGMLAFMAIMVVTSAILVDRTIREGGFALASVAAVLVGLSIYSLWARFYREPKSRRRLHYALTNRRIILVEDAKKRRLVSLDLGGLTTLDLTKHRKGYGTVSFAPQRFTYDGEAVVHMSQADDPVPQFFEIPDAQTVYDLIQKAKAHELQRLVSLQSDAKNVS